MLACHTAPRVIPQSSINVQCIMSHECANVYNDPLLDNRGERDGRKRVDVCRVRESLHEK